MKRWQELKNKIVSGLHPIYFPSALFVCIGLLLVLSKMKDSSDPTDQGVPQESIESADTYIPAGYVLVPIQLHNMASLHSLLGQYGVVDLFTPAVDQKKGVKVAEQVRIIRAPLNPSQFAVLVPEDQSQELVRHGGPFVAVLQNPKKENGGVVKSNKVRSRITYGY